MKMSKLPESNYHHAMGGKHPKICIKRVVEEIVIDKSVCAEEEKSPEQTPKEESFGLMPPPKVAAQSIDPKGESEFVQHWKDGEKTDYVMVIPYVELDSYPEPQNNPQEKQK